MKKIKVFFMGRRLRDIYPHATKWQVFKYRVRRFFRKLTLVMMFCFMLAAAFKIGSAVSPQTIYATNNVPVNTLPEKVEQLKTDLIDRLASCESAGLKEADGILTFDTNNRASIGVLQFQKQTVIHYYKTLYDQDITPKDAVEIALDKEKSYQLAKDIIFTTEKGLSNWINCGNRLALRPEVDIITKLAQ